MAFDVCEHKIRQVVIKAAIEIRKARGLPEEKNITTLFNEMAPLLGVTVMQMSSKDENHLPSPSEMKNVGGEFIIPNKPCPKCGNITFLSSICQSCEDAKDESGKVFYKSGYTCDKRTGGCGHIDEKTDEWITQRLSKMGVDIPNGTKKSIGIKTITDEGLK